MNSRKNYESPDVMITDNYVLDVLTASGDDFGDWNGTNWGSTGGSDNV